MVEDRTRLIRRQAMFWAGALAGVLAFFWLFSSILLPFVLGMVLAYFLDPIADWFTSKGLSRLTASLVILVLFLVLIIAIMLVVVPVIGSQIGSFAANLPQYLQGLQKLAIDARTGPLSWLFQDQEQSLSQDFSEIVRQSSSFFTSFAGQLWTSSLAVVNFLSLFVVTPVVAFYLLLDWDNMIAKIDSWVPRQHVVTVRRLAREIDRSVAGFVRGQGSLCLILGTYYAVGLTLVGLNFGLLIGFFAGVISFIPYVGSALGLIIAVGVALVQFSPEWFWVAATAGVFFSGQFIEGNILQPKLVGASVGLHPVWLMFALFAFGAMFGFVGLLIAVPAAAAVGVIVRFMLGKYLESEVYEGRTLEAQPATMVENFDLSADVNGGYTLNKGDDR
ncbi:AI-2E family transporter [Aureimonas fodinaquatilis]|uniref:AI-2E family transporter n=1 Tax=Aureimonas fodinaquatilis TaxID=2565783 RepID=A0A5B0DUW7_9HYPH|nr:AI-2E family transporter [Aureimonas fodinaquatilis]KAA0970233.1 AI-2E family transporter [Aureimonas fodinaquatilis]